LAVARKAVSIQKVCLTYRLVGREIQALENVTLDVWPGEFVSIVGPSGCGKSSLLRLVADLVTARTGEIQVDDMTPAEARRQHAYSFVFQNPVLLPWLTLVQNVEFAMSIVGTPAARRKAIACDRIRLVGLGGFEDALPRQLSGGMRHRAAIARALTLNPRVLLMDEPFGALDEITRQYMNLELLRILSETGAAVLFVTHSVDEAVMLSDRVVVLSPRPGQVVATIPIGLPRPRRAETRDLPEFAETAARVRHVLQEAVVC
jgi:NitT/TauT family transport system ATP-binding protein